MSTRWTQLQHGFTAMASSCVIKLWCQDTVRGVLACRKVEDEVRRIEQKYSRYRSDSVTSRINAAAGSARLELDAETVGLLGFAAQVWQHSSGMFDPTSGVLRRIWNFREARLPDADAVRALLPLIGWNKVDWRPPWIHLPVAGMELDFGGFGKEYAADRAASILLELGEPNALINLGGDIRVTGPQPEAQPWRIGITHPRRADAVIATVALSEGGLASSGDGERFMEVGGRRYSHLLDPHTGWPVQCAQLASVCAPLCIAAGAAASCALLAGTQGNRTLEGRTYLWVDADGRCSGSLASGVVGSA